MSFFNILFVVTNVYVGIQCTNIGICLNKVSLLLTIELRGIPAIHELFKFDLLATQVV